MSSDTDALLTPPYSGATFGKPLPEVASPSPLAQEIATEIEEGILAVASRRPTRRQAAILFSAAALAAGGAMLVAWVARRRG